MTYASRDDLAARFGSDEIDELAPTSGMRATAALADADAEIDAALATAYDLPLDGTFPALRAIACDVARLRLYDDAVPPEAVLGRATRSRTRLREIADGRSGLVDADGDLAARRIETGPVLGARQSAAKARLQRDSLKDY